MSGNPNSVFARPDVHVGVVQGRALLDVRDVAAYLEALSEILGRDGHALAAEVVRQDMEALKDRARRNGDQRFG